MSAPRLTPHLARRIKLFLFNIRDESAEYRAATAALDAIIEGREPTPWTEVSHASAQELLGKAQRWMAETSVEDPYTRQLVNALEAHLRDAAEKLAPNESPQRTEWDESDTEHIERIMTRHYDLAACNCWLCEAGRARGMQARSAYLLTR